MVSKYIDPSDIEPHYSTAFCRSHKTYLQNLYSPTMFSEICDELKVPEEYLLRHENWVSNSFMSRYIDKLIEKTRDPEIAYKIGKNFWDPNSINALEYTLQRLIPPLLFYFLYPIQVSKLNLFTKYKATLLRPGQIIYTVKQEGKIHPGICANMVGVLEGTKDIFKLNYIDVKHEKCVHKGNDECVFEFSYGATNYWKKKLFTLGIYLSAIFGLYLLFGKIVTDDNISKQVFIFTLLGCIGALFGTILLGIKVFAIVGFNKTFYEQSQRKNEELFDKNKKLDRRYQESNLMRNLSLKLVKLSSSKEVISSALSELEKRFGFERAVVQLVDTSNAKLFTMDVRGFGEHTDMLFKLSFKYPAEKDSPQIFANILEKGECTLIDNIDNFKKDLEPQNQVLLTAFGVKSLIVAPIQDATTKYGLLIIGSIGADRQLTTEDQHLIENITRMLALFFQNARNFEKERTLKTLFQKYVPPVVIDGIRHLEAGGGGHLVPKNNAVSSIFVDLRDFTALSEDQAPQRVVEMLNLYIDYVSGYVAVDGGIIDNLVGDGVVAFFPAADDDRIEHARKALKCAIRILANLDTLNARLVQKGFPKVRIGIGLHSGNATVGNIGSDRKMNYTAIGDTVNLASRLETLCKKYADATSTSEQGLLIFSEGVYGRAKIKIPKIEVGKIRIRGRNELVQVYLLDKKMAMGIDLDHLEFLTGDEKREDTSPIIELEAPEGRRRSDKKAKKAS